MDPYLLSAAATACGDAASRGAATAQSLLGGLRGPSDPATVLDHAVQQGPQEIPGPKPAAAPYPVSGLQSPLQPQWAAALQGGTPKLGGSNGPGGADLTSVLGPLMSAGGMSAQQQVQSQPVPFCSESALLRPCTRSSANKSAHVGAMHALFRSPRWPKVHCCSQSFSVGKALGGRHSCLSGHLRLLSTRTFEPSSLLQQQAVLEQAAQAQQQAAQAYAQRNALAQYQHPIDGPRPAPGYSKPHSAFERASQQTPPPVLPRARPRQAGGLLAAPSLSAATSCCETCSRAGKAVFFRCRL